MLCVQPATSRDRALRLAAFNLNYEKSEPRASDVKRTILPAYVPPSRALPVRNTHASHRATRPLLLLDVPVATARHTA